MSDKVLVCRCEDVTLDELEHAFDAGHHDVQSVKRFTGFGTGWCQGKQCVALCARWLEAKTGHAPDEPITPRPPTHPIELGLLAKLGDLLDEDAAAASDALSTERDR